MKFQKIILSILFIFAIAIELFTPRQAEFSIYNATSINTGNNNSNSDASIILVVKRNYSNVHRINTIVETDSIIKSDLNSKITNSAYCLDGATVPLFNKLTVADFNHPVMSTHNSDGLHSYLVHFLRC